MADVKPLKKKAGVNTQMETGDTVSVANGGTGQATLTAHGLLIGNGTGAIANTGAGTAGQLMVSGGASADPAWSGSFVGAATTVHKTASQSIANSTTLVNDNHFLNPIAVNERQKGHIVCIITAGASGGFKLDFSAPSGATGNYKITATNSSFQSSWTAIGTPFGATTTITNIVAIISYDITNSSTPGDVTLQWAQNATNGTNTTIFGGTLTAVRVS